MKCTKAEHAVMSYCEGRLKPYKRMALYMHIKKCVPCAMHFDIQASCAAMLNGDEHIAQTHDSFTSQVMKAVRAIQNTACKEQTQAVKIKESMFSRIVRICVGASAVLFGLWFFASYAYEQFGLFAGSTAVQQAAAAFWSLAAGAERIFNAIADMTASYDKNILISWPLIALMAVVGLLFGCSFIFGTGAMSGRER